MAYQIVEAKFWDEWYPYVGEYCIFEAEYTGPPEQILPKSIAAKVIEFYVKEIQAAGHTMLFIRIDADISPTWETKYRIKSFSHGSPGLPLAAIYGIIAAVLVIGLAIIVWQTSDAIKETSEHAPAALSLGILALVGIVVIAGIYFIRRGGLALPKGD